MADYSTNVRLPSETGNLPNNPNKTRQRASQACLECRARKVRCNLTQQHPCSNCVAGGKSCRAPNPLHKNTGHAQNPSESRSPRSEPPDLAVSYSGDRAYTTTAAPAFNTTVSADARGSGSDPAALAVDSRSMFRASSSGPVNPNGRASNSVEGTMEPPYSVDDQIWVRNLQSMSSSTPVSSEAGLSPELSAHAPQNTGPARKRMKFGDEPLAHSMLPHMRGHAELEVNLGRQSDQGLNHRTLSLPRPMRAVYPCGKVPWINADCEGHLRMLSHLEPHEQYYLYSMTGVFRFPQRSVASVLMVSFFESLFPLLPIVDRCQTAALFNMLYTYQQSSPLLLHAIFFSACQYADEDILHRAGFSTILQAKTYFFRRAKLLYMHDCEPDHLKVLQSLILLSYWWMDYTEEKDMRYWLAGAVNLSTTMGMHRTVPKSLNMSLQRQRLWRRIFWSLFGREHNVSLALGQPYQIRLADCDLVPFCEDDLHEETDLDIVPHDIKECLSGGPWKGYVHVNLKHVDLACRTERLLQKVNDAPGPLEKITALDSMTDLCSRENFLIPEAAMETLSLEDPSSWTKHNCFAAFHFLNHERLSTLYYRIYEKALIALEKSKATAVGFNVLIDGVLTTPSHNSEQFDSSSKLRQIRSNIFLSADRVFQIVEKLHSRGLLRYCPSFVTTSLFHALLSLADWIVSSDEGSSQQREAREKFYAVLAAVGELRKYWSSAQWNHAMFSNLAQNDFKPLKESPDQTRWTKHLAQPRSSLVSRTGSPINGQWFGTPMYPFTWDLFDTVLSATEFMPFSTDPLSHIQGSAGPEASGCREWSDLM